MSNTERTNKPTGGVRRALAEELMTFGSKPNLSNAAQQVETSSENPPKWKNSQTRSRVAEDAVVVLKSNGSLVSGPNISGQIESRSEAKSKQSPDISDILDIEVLPKDTEIATNTLDVPADTIETKSQLYLFRTFGPSVRDFSVKNVLNEIENEREALKNEVADLKRQLEELKAKISGLETDSTKISPTLTPRTTGEVIQSGQDYWELELKLSELKEELQAKESMLSELENSFAGKDAEISELNRQKGFLNGGIQRIGEEIFQFEATRKNKEDEYARVNMSLTEKVRKLEIEVKEIDSFRKQLAELEELRLAMFNSQSKYLSEMTDKNDELVGKNRRLSTELDQEKNFLAQARAKIDELLAELKVMNKANSDLRGETQNENIKREESISWSEYELLKIQEVLSWSEYNYGQKENALKSFDQILKLKQEELRGKESNVAAQKRIINSLKSELETIKIQLDSEKKQAASFQELSTQLQSQVNELNQSLVQAQKRHDDVVGGLASTFRSTEERQRLEKEDLSKRNEELDAKLNFIRQRTKDLVARTKESRAEKKQRLENERLIQEQSNKERSLYKNAEERWKDERVRVEKEELDKKRKEVSNIKRVDKLFEYALSFLDLESNERIDLRKQICEYIYSDKQFENSKLANIGFFDKLDELKEEYFKNIKDLEERVKSNKSWEEIEKTLELNIFYTTFSFPEDMNESFANHVRVESSILEKYLGKELAEKIYQKKREFNAKNALEVKQIKLQKAIDTFSVSLLQKATELERPFGLDMALVENLIAKYGGDNFTMEKLDQYFGLVEEYTLEGKIRFENEEYSTKKDFLNAVFNSLKKQILEVSTDLNGILDKRQVKAKLQNVVNSKPTFNIILKDMISKTFKEKGKMFVEYDDIYYVLSDRNQINLFTNAFYRKVASRI